MLVCLDKSRHIVNIREKLTLQVVIFFTARRNPKRQTLRDIRIHRRLLLKNFGVHHFPTLRAGCRVAVSDGYPVGSHHAPF